MRAVVREAGESLSSTTICTAFATNKRILWEAAFSLRVLFISCQFESIQYRFLCGLTYCPTRFMTMLSSPSILRKNPGFSLPPPHQWFRRFFPQLYRHPVSHGKGKDKIAHIMCVVTDALLNIIFLLNAVTRKWWSLNKNFSSLKVTLWSRFKGSTSMNFYGPLSALWFHVCRY